MWRSQFIDDLLGHTTMMTTPLMTTSTRSSTAVQAALFAITVGEPHTGSAERAGRTDTFVQALTFSGILPTDVIGPCRLVAPSNAMGYLVDGRNTLATGPMLMICSPTQRC
jgi:hypothetical protein